MQNDATSPPNMSPDPEPLIWTEALFREALNQERASEILKKKDSKGVTGLQFGVRYNGEEVERLRPLLKLLEPSPRETSQLQVIVNLLQAIGSTQERILEGQRRAEADHRAIVQRLARIEQTLSGSEQA